MARVKGPLFSFEASGSLKKSITYAQWKGRNYVRSHTIPSNPQTPTQVNVRAAFTLLVALWKTLAPADVILWNDFGKTLDYSGFNAFVGRGQKEYAIQLTTAVPPVSVLVVGAPPIEVWTWAAV